MNKLTKNAKTQAEFSAWVFIRLLHSIRSGRQENRTLAVQPNFTEQGLYESNLGIRVLTVRVDKGIYTLHVIKMDIGIAEGNTNRFLFTVGKGIIEGLALIAEQTEITLRAVHSHVGSIDDQIAVVRDFFQIIGVL